METGIGDQRETVGRGVAPIVAAAGGELGQLVDLDAVPTGARQVDVAGESDTLYHSKITH